MSVDEARPRIPIRRQNTDQILSYYLNSTPDSDDTDAVDDHDHNSATPRRPTRPGAPPENRRLHIVELDGQHDLSRRFDRSRLALVAPPETAGAPSPMDSPSPQLSTPLMTPAIGESKQIGTKVAPPVTTRLGSQDTWLPPSSPTKAAERSVSPRGAPPPRPPRLSSPPPRGSPAQSFNSLASAASAVSAAAPDRRRIDEESRLAPGGVQMTRGNSDYSIMAVSDSSERSTPKDEVSEPASPTLAANGGGSSHRREGAFPAHSVFTAQSANKGDGLPEPSSTDDRAFYLNGKSPLRVVGESEDEDVPERRGSPSRSNTITSRSTRSDTITISPPSTYTPASSSNYTSSNVSRTATQDAAGDDMLDLIATVGSALHDLGVDPADVPPATVFPPPDESKPTPAVSRRGSIDNLRGSSLDGAGFRSSPKGSTVNLVRHANGSPSTSRAGSPRAEFTRGSPRTSTNDVARGSPRTLEFSPRGSPRTSLTELSRGSPRPKSYMDPRPSHSLSRSSSPDKRGGEGSFRSRSPEKGAREVSPEKHRGDGAGSRSSPDTGVSRSVRSRSPDKDRTGVPLITRSSYEQTPVEPSSTSAGSIHTTSASTLRSRSPTSPSPRTLPRARSSTSLARSSPLRNVVGQPRYKQGGAPLPECFAFGEVLRMKTSAERAQAYVRKINQLAAEDSGLGYWVGYMKGRVRPDVQGPPAAGPLSPSALVTTFGPHGPGTRRAPQPRHVSGGSTTSEATFAVRPDAYVATNISVRADSPPLGPPPSLPYPSLARDIGVRSATSMGAIVAGSGSASGHGHDGALRLAALANGSGALRNKVGAVGFFSTIGRKASTRRDRDRAVMQQARKPARGAGPGYAELPVSVKPVQLSAVPTIPGGPRARGARPQAAKKGPGSDTASTISGAGMAGVGTGGAALNPRSSVIMIGGRDSFQTVSHDGHGRPVSIRVPSSNGHGVVVPNLPVTSPRTVEEGVHARGGMRSPEAPSSYRGTDVGSVYSGYSGRESGYSARGSVYGGGSGGGRGSSALGHGSVDQLADVLPDVDRAVLARYLERADGHEIDAISAYMEDEKRGKGGGGGSSVGHGGYI